MKQFYALLEGLAWVAAIVGLLTGLAGCAGSLPLTTTLSQPVDSTLQHQAAEQRARALVQGLTTGKVKFKGPVTFQIGGTGNTATDAHKAKAPVAAAPHATASETKTSRGVPWQVYAGVALVLFAAGFLLRGKLKIPLPF